MSASQLIDGRRTSVSDPYSDSLDEYELVGVPQLMVEEVIGLSDERLLRLVPVVSASVQLYYDDGQLAVRIVSLSRSTTVFPDDGPENQLLEYCDGTRNFVQICRELMEQPSYRGMSLEEVRDLVKDIARRLIKRRICLSLDPTG